MSRNDWFKFTMVWRKNLKSGNLNARIRPMVSFEDIVVFYKEQPTYNPIKIPRTFQKKAGNTKNSKTKNYGKQRENYLDRQTDSLMPDDVIDEEDDFFYYEDLEDMEVNPPMLHVKAKHNANGKRHPTEKPVALMKWLINTFTNEGDTVLDNTMGSASTISAALSCKRKAIGIEKDKQYFTIAKERIKEETNTTVK